MLRITYNPKTKTVCASNPLKKGRMEFDEKTSTYTCEVSDITDMGIFNMPPMYEILNEESGDITVFRIDLIKRNSDSDILYWLFKSPDGFIFQINDPEKQNGRGIFLIC